MEKHFWNWSLLTANFTNGFKQQGCPLPKNHPQNGCCTHKNEATPLLKCAQRRRGFDHMVSAGFFWPSAKDAPVKRHSTIRCSREITSDLEACLLACLLVFFNPLVPVEFRKLICRLILKPGMQIDPKDFSFPGTFRCMRDSEHAPSCSWIFQKVLCSNVQLHFKGRFKIILVSQTFKG